MVSEAVLVVGGSGLHFRSVVDPMTFRPTEPTVRSALADEPLERLRAELLAADADAARHVDLANPRRVLRAVETLRIAGLTPTEWAGSDERRRYRDYESELDFVGIAIDRPDLEERVALRLDRMREGGFHARLLKKRRRWLVQIARVPGDSGGRAEDRRGRWSHTGRATELRERVSGEQRSPKQKAGWQWIAVQ